MDRITSVTPLKARLFSPSDPTILDAMSEFDAVVAQCLAELDKQEPAKPAKPTMVVTDRIHLTPKLVIDSFRQLDKRGKLTAEQRMFLYQFDGNESLDRILTAMRA